MKIGILGMGGVGSFIGAHLTKSYENDDKTTIIFICRGKSKEAILKNGLIFSSQNTTFTVRPDLVSDHPSEIGTLDILILATKSYDAKSGLKTFKECINERTVIIPLQNIVNPKELLADCIEYESNILEGCIYVASNIVEPGFVKHVGGPGKVFFGNENERDLQWVESVLQKGGIDATYTRNIKNLLWKKYLFVSPVATITTAFNITFGQLAENPVLIVELEGMMTEIQRLAKEFNVILTQTDVTESLAMLNNFPYAAKSSLQLDFENKKPKTEKAYFVDFIIENAQKHNLTVDIYKKMNRKILAERLKTL